MRARRTALLLVAATGAVAARARAADVPFLSGRVVDTAEILSTATRDSLTAALAAHEQATGNQIAVLTVPTLGGESIEDYATRTFASWKLGQKGKDNGVLVVVVPRDRKMRIEVGYGLEPTLTDLIAGRIIHDVMTPAFKAGDYDRGVSDGARAIVGILEGRPAAAAAPRAARSGAGSKTDMPWQMRLLFGLFALPAIGLITYVQLITPGTGCFIYFFLIPFWFLFPLFIVGEDVMFAMLVVYLIGFPITKIILSRSAWYQKAAAELKDKGSARIGGLTISAGGGSSSGGGGGGGFSGGGGSSGGGGASGSW